MYVCILSILNNKVAEAKLKSIADKQNLCNYTWAIRKFFPFRKVDCMSKTNI